MQKTKFNNLLRATHDIVEEHKKVRKEKGEDFNIFSILNMETNETKTHSGMLVALLDPKGAHYQNEKFLKCFLEEVKYDYVGENLNFVRVKSEHHLGQITKDFKQGGYIDILITFPSGKAIAIENKIYAKDQPKQMYRYSLYKKELCQLYYLNLFGEKPTVDSLFDLTDNDYEIITYQNHILNWLNSCIKIVTKNVALTNTIKQYQILIKQLTHTMDQHLEENLKQLIVNNLVEAKYIHTHYEKAVYSIREKFRNAVFNELQKTISDYIISLGNDATHVFSQIWISTDYLNKKGIAYGIESFSGRGHNGGRIFIGVFDRNNEYETQSNSDSRLNGSWPIIRDLKTDLDNPLNLTSITTLEQLISDNQYFDNLVIKVVNQVSEFIETYNEVICPKTNLK